MNQKLRFFFTMLLLSVVSVGFAGSITFGDLGLENGVQYSDPFDGGDFTVTFAGGENDGKYYTTGSGIRVYANGTMTIAANSGNITEITITYSGSNKPSSSTVANVGTYTPSTGTWTGGAESVVFTNPSGGSQWRVQKIEVTVSTEPVKQDAGLSFGSNTSFTVEVGAGFTAPTLDNPNSLEVTYSSSDEDIALVDETTGDVVLGEKLGTATITASSAETDVFYAGRASYTITLKAAPVTISFPWSEDFSSNSLDGYDISGNTSIQNEKLADGEAPELMIGKSGGSFSVIINMNGNHGDMVLTFKANYDRVTVTTGEGGTLGDVKFANKSYTIPITVAEGTQKLTLTFSNSTSSNVRVDDFSLSIGKQDAGLLFEETSFNVAPDGDFTAPTLTNPHNLTVTYSSSDENLAVVDENTGEVLIGTNEGSVTITASFAGNETYYAASASYTIVIGTPHGTAENPYTVAEARAAIDAGTSVTDVYATGIVSEIVTSYNSQYGNISYNISDDGTTTADQLQAFRGKSYNGENFTSEDDIKVGDVVVIKGNLIKYGSTYEFAQDNQLVSLERPVVPTISVEEELELAYDATSGEIEYTIENPVEGKSLTAETTAEWISGITVGAESVTFTTTVNESDADRTATITLAYDGAVSKTVTVTQKCYVAPVETKTYAKVTSTADITDGNYLIVYEEGSVAFNGSLETLDAVGNTIEVILNNGKTEAPENAAFTIDVTNGTIKSASGYYIGWDKEKNGLSASGTEPFTNTISYDADKKIAVIQSYTSAYLQYNNDNGQKRFRYFASGSQKAIQLYKEVKDEPYTLSISSAATDGTSYFATMANIGNGNFIVPDGVTVSTVQVDDKGKIIMNEVGTVIPGSKAYLVEASEAKEYTFAVTTEEPSDVTLGLLEDNMLYPSVVGAQTSIAPYGIGEDSEYTFYKLANGKKANSVGFYYGDEGGIPFVSKKENGAFLAVPKDIYDPSASANPGVILINPDDDADGIQGISTSELKNAEVYTLTGVRVQGNLQKGIYIVNGRKQVIK